jgi:DNA-directed RNA polymerase alpha subunit
MSKASKKTSFIENIKYPYEKKWDKNKTNVSFEFNNISISMINALRRTIISDLKTIAFRSEPYDKSNIKVIKNDSSLHNEFIAHRIGMIPLNILDENFDCDDYEFIIEEKNITNFPKQITSDHFKILQISTNKLLSKQEVSKIFPRDAITNEPILITELKPSYNIINYKMDSYKDELLNTSGKEQYFHINAKASLSNGEENSRYSPVSAISYSYFVDEEKAKIAKIEYIKNEIEKMKEKGLKPKTEEQLSRYFETTLKERYFIENDEGEPIKFNFNIESIGYIPPLIIFHKSIEYLVNRIDGFLINIKSYNDNIIDISPSTNINGGFQMIINGENDTLGNIIQEEFFELFCNENDEEQLLDYIGYKRTHPLEEKIIINIRSSKFKSWNDIISNIFDVGCKSIIKKLNSIKKDVEKQKEFIKELKTI